MVGLLWRIFVGSSPVTHVEEELSAYCLWDTFRLHGKQKEIPKALFLISFL